MFVNTSWETEMILKNKKLGKNYEKHPLFPIPIYGEHGRFPEHKKTCDTSKIHSLSGHDHRYRYLISYKNTKRGKSAEPILPMITRKHNIAKFCYGGDMLKKPVNIKKL
jgi:hypothetical protein